MNKESCYEIGFVTKPHGLNGAVTITFDVDNPLQYQKLESVFLEISGRLVPFFISKIQVRDNSAIVEFEEINTRDQFEEIKSAKLFLPLNFLPQLSEDEFYYHEVVGFKVVDRNLGDLGTIAGFNTSGPQPIMVMKFKEKEVLIPASKEIVIKPNKQEKTMDVDLPEGLLEIYLEEE